MNSLLKELTAQMSDGLRAEYVQKFKRIYSAENLPPVVTLDDIGDSIPYEEGTRAYKTSLHIGQRKLFLSELQFLTKHALGSSPRTQTVVYAGAAPSIHTGLLSSLFPGVKFILVDPAKFAIRGAAPTFLSHGTDDEIIYKSAHNHNKIICIGRLFTHEMARAVAKYIPDCLFISDIRTNITEGQAPPDSVDILWNMAQQFNWVVAMSPRKAMLKFRHPFYTEAEELFLAKSRESPYAEEFALAKRNGIDFISNYAGKVLEYFDGTVYIQAWAGQSSTESRLVTSGMNSPARIRNWGSPDEYEGKFFYYNAIERCYGLHMNENADVSLGFDYCGDCALENVIWKEYLEAGLRTNKYAGSSVKDMVRELSRAIRRGPRFPPHGEFFSQYSARTLRETMRAADSGEKKKRTNAVNSSCAEGNVLNCPPSRRGVDTRRA